MHTTQWYIHKNESKHSEMGPVRQNPIQRTVSLFICVCIALCTIVAHNIVQNRPDSFPPYPPDNHHCSDDVYLREGGTAESRMHLVSRKLVSSEAQHETGVSECYLGVFRRWVESFLGIIELRLTPHRLRRSQSRMILASDNITESPEPRRTNNDSINSCQQSHTNK